MWCGIQIEVISNLSACHDYHHCLVVTDLHSNWVDLLPLRTQDAIEVSTNLHQLIARYGIPKQIFCAAGKICYQRNLLIAFNFLHINWLFLLKLAKK